MKQEKATKLDHKVEHLSIPISHRQQSIQGLQDSRNGWME